MAREIPSLYSLNRGVVDRRGLARVDVKRLAMAAQQQTNWMAKVLGPMTLRVGLAYLGGILNNSPARQLKFQFATNDLAEMELTDSSMRVWIGDAVLTRSAVATTITNGTFDTDLTGWTSFDGSGATSSWVAPGYLQLAGNGTNQAVREQHVTNSSPNVEHGIRIVITRGPVYMRIGSNSGADDLLSETVLYTGTHSIAISPGASDFYIRFFSSASQVVWVDACTIEAAGAVVLPTPWTASDLNNIRYDQSADVLFVACKGRQQRRIERRGARPGGRGWSVVLYQSPDGPFLLQNTGPITLAASAITGNITVTASQALFKTTHVGALFSLKSVGQQTTVAAAAANSFSPSIRVTGISAQRTFGILIAGTFVATVVLQQSFDNATWADVAGKSWTAPVGTTYADGLDNQIVYYRIGIEALYTSGTANATLTFSQGSIRGVVRITGYTSSTSVSAEVLTSLGGTAATTVWEEGKWSDLRGWPTAVGIHEGRMWWAGQNGIVGSLSDAFDSFDETFLGDAGTIDRTVGSGPVDTINWILSLKGMLLGAQGAEYSVRSSSLDEPLTPTNFNLKASSTQGSGSLAAVKVDQMGYFIDRTGCKLYELAFDIRSYDYTSIDVMELAPEIGLPGIVRMDVQRKPDTRVHMVRSDGTVIVCVLNTQEEVRAMIPITTTDGLIEDVVVQPAIAGNLDDQVYYIVRRSINGVTVRYREKWAQEVECRGDQQQCKLADSHVTYSGAPTTVISAPHLIGQPVVVWADGADIGTDDSTTTWVQRYTVDGSGNVTLPTAHANVVVGLPYTAQFQSAKLGVQSTGSMLNQQKKIGHLGLILADTHRRGVRFGPSFDYLDDMPLIENGTLVTQEVEADYDENLIEFPGTWTTDMRVCVVGAAPRPATVMAITIDEVQNN